MSNKELNSNLSVNLQYLMQNHKLKSVDLAEALNVSAELIGKLKNGVLNNPTLKVLAGLSAYFDIPLQDLVFANLQHSNIINEIKSLNYVPIIEWSKIKNWQENTSGKSVILENNSSKSIFAIHLDNDYGTFQKDSLIFIDTKLVPQNHDYILVLNKKVNKFYIKRLLVEELSYLQSIIPEINSIIEYNTDDYLIFGVITGYQKLMFFRG